MSKRFKSSAFSPFAFIFFIIFYSIFIIQDFDKQGVTASVEETENIEKLNALKVIRSKDGRFIDNGDGTIFDTKTKLMWTKKGSYSDLGKCLNWFESREYVGNLQTGRYNDWRMPAVKELKTIFEESKSNNMIFDNDLEYPFHLDSIFADGAAHGFWTSDDAGSCCAHTFYFSNGKDFKVSRDFCDRRGVRAVRKSSSI